MNTSLFQKAGLRTLTKMEEELAFTFPAHLKRHAIGLRVVPVQAAPILRHCELSL
jgi:hypothetical protein